MVAETLRRLNPAVSIVTARYGMVDAEPVAVLALVEAPAAAVAADHACHEDHEHGATCGHNHDEAHEHTHDHAGSDLGFINWHTDLATSCDADALQFLLEQIAAGRYGDILRVKGLARSGAGWLRFDVAGGRPSMTAFAAAIGETPRIVVIGRKIDTAALTTALSDCSVKQAA
jgi:G3E family GTPase